jgi:hypothetical protein
MRQWQQLAELATSTSRERLTIMLPGAIRAERAGNLLTLTHA